MEKKRKNNPPILYKKWLEDHKDLTVKEILEVAIVEEDELAAEEPVVTHHKAALIFAFTVDLIWSIVRILLVLFLVFAVVIAIIVLINPDLRNYLIDAIYYSQVRYFGGGK